jgi:hypothetical protein
MLNCGSATRQVIVSDQLIKQTSAEKRTMADYWFDGRLPSTFLIQLSRDCSRFQAVLNDCVSGLKWVHANKDALNIDPKQIIVAGESGGGNLTLATGLKLKREGQLGLIKGLYALCPYIAGEWPQTQYPSSIEDNGIFIDVAGNQGAMAYGIEAFNARDPLAWPASRQAKT